MIKMRQLCKDQRQGVPGKEKNKYKSIDLGMNLVRLEEQKIDSHGWRGVNKGVRDGRAHV